MTFKTSLNERAIGSRRDRQRQPINLKARISGHSGHEIDVRLLDMSASGVLLSSIHPLELGAELAINLPDATDKRLTVLWRSGALHGCQFDAPLSRRALSSSLLRSDFVTHDTSALGTVESEGMQDQPESIGFRIARLRKLRNWTQADLAEALGVSKTTVCNWEKGYTRPRREALQLLGGPKEAAEAALPNAAAQTEDCQTPSSLSDIMALVDFTKSRLSEVYGIDESRITITIAI